MYESHPSQHTPPWMSFMPWMSHFELALAPGTASVTLQLTSSITHPLIRRVFQLSHSISRQAWRGDCPWRWRHDHPLRRKPRLTPGTCKLPSTTKTVLNLFRAKLETTQLSEWDYDDIELQQKTVLFRINDSLRFRKSSSKRAREEMWLALTRASGISL